MYDVLFMERKRGASVVACGLERERATELAREEARRRQVGRMFLAGSVGMPLADAIVIVRSGANVDETPAVSAAPAIAA
jgi:hypothetical protein